jgi:hypothetical protein
MIKIDFNTMTKKELRASVIAHPIGKDAFRIFVDRFTLSASPEIFAMSHSIADLSEIDSLIKQRLEQSS